MPRLPTAAIIIPAYNCADTLERTLESVMASIAYAFEQGLEAEYEVAVVDDGSTDDTVQIAERMQAEHGEIKIIQQENAGPGAARNTGVRETIGQFLFFLDSDDVYYPNHIYLCLSKLLERKDLGYVYTKLKIDMPMHPDWPPSIDEGNPINFCIRRVWHDMVEGFAVGPDFTKYRTEDTVYRVVIRDLVKYEKIEEFTCEQFVSPGNALDRQREKFSMSMPAWTRSGGDDGFVLTEAMEKEIDRRLARLKKLMGG